MAGLTLGIVGLGHSGEDLAAKAKAGATSHQTPRRGVEILLENLRRHLAGESLVNVVDLQAGY